MKILHIVYSLIPGEYRGGVPKAVFELARAQAGLGHEVWVFTTDYNSGRRVPVLQEDILYTENVRIKYFPALKIGNVLFSGPLYRHLIKNTDHFGVIHAHNIFHPLNRYAHLAGSKHKIPVFYHTHGALDPKATGKGMLKRLKKTLFLRWIEIPALAASAGIFVCSDEEREQVRSRLRDADIHVLPNGISFTPRALQRPYDRLPVTFLFIGRIHPKKGIHHLLHGFSKIAGTHAGARLVIGGDPAANPGYARKLRKIIRDENLDTRVHWTGFLNEAEKYKWLSEADIFCHLSESEGMAISILEAMSMGLPVVASKDCYMGRAGAANALIECDPGEENSVARSLRLLLDNPGLRRETGRNASEYISRHHSWETIAARSLDVYRLHAKNTDHVL